MEFTTMDRKSFLADELGSLRQQVQSAVREARLLERYTLALTGGVWSWLLTNRDRELPEIAWWIPLFLAVLVLARETVLYLEIRDLAAYIRQRETEWLDKSGGWETSVSKSSHQIRGWRVPSAAILFWALLLGGTALGPLWLIR